MQTIIKAPRRALTALGVAAALGLTAFVGASVMSPAAATGTPICHPVEGKGETGTGWVIESPDKASSHIDESLYPDGHYWKHETKDGRHDVYATSTSLGWTCPGGEVPPSTTTTGSPSSTTTTTVPTTVTSTTTQPTTVTSTTTQPTTTTSTTSTTSSPSETTSSTSTTSSTTSPPTTTSTSNSSTNSPKPPKTRTTSVPAPSSPTSSQPPTQLAFTGADPRLVWLGMLLLCVGLTIYWLLNRRRQH